MCSHISDITEDLPIFSNQEGAYSQPEAQSGSVSATGYGPDNTRGKFHPDNTALLPGYNSGLQYHSIGQASHFNLNQDTEAIFFNASITPNHQGRVFSTPTTPDYLAGSGTAHRLEDYAPQNTYHPTNTFLGARGPFPTAFPGSLLKSTVAGLQDTYLNAGAINYHTQYPSSVSGNQYIPSAHAGVHSQGWHSIPTAVSTTDDGTSSEFSFFSVDSANSNAHLLALQGSMLTETSVDSARGQYETHQPVYPLQSLKGRAVQELVKFSFTSNALLFGAELQRHIHKTWLDCCFKESCPDGNEIEYRQVKEELSFEYKNTRDTIYRRVEKLIDLPSKRHKLRDVTQADLQRPFPDLFKKPSQGKTEEQAFKENASNLIHNHAYTGFGDPSGGDQFLKNNGCFSTIKGALYNRAENIRKLVHPLMHVFKARCPDPCISFVLGCVYGVLKARARTGKLRKAINADIDWDAVVLETAWIEEELGRRMREDPVWAVNHSQVWAERSQRWVSPLAANTLHSCIGFHNKLFKTGPFHD
ncbi:hypothetical protein BV22DRAFT_1133537 [Leucogyrophana mollusca]|uniref:Uncharacterized protein n=1 Tax=Leucogyrophana mollusca TaxID=85980 RepID=A0ACB8B2F3_9AGAM|nr:hypothetical protein BV22DRAFT_1133537 [Leucogyrophana mollusca]